MKKYLTILLLLVSISLNATIKWVTPRGNDSNNGADSASTGAWGTWDKAFSTAVAGDTVYFRGGVYYAIASGNIYEVGHSGSDGNYINFWAYPPDYEAGNYPIFDFGRIQSADYTYILRARLDSYIHWKGLEIRNVTNTATFKYVVPVYIEDSHHLIVENLRVHHISGPAILSVGCTETYIKNCDVWEICDTLNPNPGQNGSGIGVNTRLDQWGDDMYDAKVYVEGCRAWNCSDQGFANTGVGYHEWKNCWTFSNGRLEGDGMGMKLSISTASSTVNPLSRVYKNCIFAVNAGTGWDVNNCGGNVMNGHYYNNFIYRNGYKPWVSYYQNYYIGTGIWICGYASGEPHPAPNEIYLNNISYDNEKGTGGAYVASDIWKHENNSWDQTGLTVTDDDFISLDTLELYRPRKADGSLPDIDFGKLAAGSDLIDAGAPEVVTTNYNIPLPYNGTAPDLGWFEYEEEEEEGTGIKIIKHNGKIIKHNGKFVIIN